MGPPLDFSWGCSRLAMRYVLQKGPSLTTARRTACGSTSSGKDLKSGKRMPMMSKNGFREKNAARAAAVR